MKNKLCKHSGSTVAVFLPRRLQHQANPNDQTSISLLVPEQSFHKASKLSLCNSEKQLVNLNIEGRTQSILAINTGTI